MGLVRRWKRFGLLALLAFGWLLWSPAPADAHGGGLDSSGGHHCRTAGYNSGKCAPLNSYHCHQAPCTETAAEVDTTPEPPAVQGQVETTPTTLARSASTGMANTGPVEVGIAAAVGGVLLVAGSKMRGRRAAGTHYDDK